MALKFGELLLEAKLINEEQLQHALEHQHRHPKRIGEILVDLGYLSPEDLIRTLGRKYGVATVNLDECPVDGESLRMVPAEMAHTLRVLPLQREGSTLVCAMEDPTSFDAIQAVEFQTDCNVRVVLTTPAQLTRALDAHYPTAPGSPPGPGTSSQGSSAGLLEDIQRRLHALPAAKLESVRRFLDSIA